MTKVIEDIPESTKIIVGGDLFEFSAVDLPAMEHSVITSIKRKVNDLRDKNEEVISKDVRASSAESEDATNTEKSNMSEKTEEIKDEAEKVDVDKLVKEAVIKSLSTEQAEFYEKSNKSVKKEFLASDCKGRDEMIAKDKASRVIAYKSADGTEYGEDADPKLVEMAKRIDDLERSEIEKSEKSAHQAIVSKLETSYKNLPGSEKSKIATLKAIESIEDEDDRSEAYKILDFANSAIGRAMTTFGSETTKSVEYDASDKADASRAFEDLAQTRAKKDSISIHKARVLVMNENKDMKRAAMSGFKAV